jgi:hypothetical protein
MRAHRRPLLWRYPDLPVRDFV